MWLVPPLAAMSVACSSTSNEQSAAPASTAPTTTQPTTTTAPPTTLGNDGATIFKLKCAGCHGTSGEGNLGPSLIGIASRMPREQQIEVVSNGRATMLAFSPALTDQQIAAVVDYTRDQLH